MLPKKECVHISKILEKTIYHLNNLDPLALKELSNQTIHSACAEQDEGTITTAVLIYALSKIVERDDHKRIKNWPAFTKKFTALLKVAAKAIKENNQPAFQKHIEKARKTLESQSINLKPYIQGVLKKASINKGSKIHEHGISREQTSKLLGITQWELSDYIGQKNIADAKQNQTLHIRQRAKMALEFFS